MWCTLLVSVIILTPFFTYVIHVTSVNDHSVSFYFLCDVRYEYLWSFWHLFLLTWYMLQVSVTILTVFISYVMYITRISDHSDTFYYLRDTCYKCQWSFRQFLLFMWCTLRVSMIILTLFITYVIHVTSVSDHSDSFYYLCDVRYACPVIILTPFITYMIHVTHVSDHSDSFYYLWDVRYACQWSYSDSFYHLRDVRYACQWSIWHITYVMYFTRVSDHSFWIMVKVPEAPINVVYQNLTFCSFCFHILPPKCFVSFAFGSSIVFMFSPSICLKNICFSFFWNILFCLSCLILLRYLPSQSSQANIFCFVCIVNFLLLNKSDT